MSITTRVLRSFMMAVSAALLAVPFAAFAQLYTATLASSNEVPPVTSTATGSAMVAFVGGSLAYDIQTTNLTGGTAAHIHRGAAGVNGPVVINFVPTFTATGARGTVVTVDPALAQEIANNPAGFYVNVHTSTNPGGEIRGQLSSLPSTTLRANLFGSNEVPPVDIAGNGTATVLLGSGMIAYGLNLNNITNVQAAHIHRGAAGANGPVLIDFAPSFVGNVATGVFATSAQNIADITANPAGFYVNVHTAGFPTGAVRGQLTTLAAIEVRDAPTLSQWMMIVLALLLGVIAFRMFPTTRRTA
jgi:CHRD domain/IPTL-CTERM motif